MPANRPTAVANTTFAVMDKPLTTSSRTMRGTGDRGIR